VSERIDEINNKYLDIWEKYHNSDNLEIKDLLAKVPMQYSAFEKSTNGVLYIGLNPSLIKERTDDPLFNWHNKNECISKQTKILQFEINAKFDSQFFKPMRDFSIKTDTAWQHIDVFPIRKTSSRDLAAELKGLSLEEELLEIFDELLASILENSAPKLIVVVNAKASHKLHSRWVGKICVWDDIRCCYELAYHDKITPVFFSGQLTGGASDTYSQDRLFWLMKKIIYE
jgi:hypothetical protein